MYLASRTGVRSVSDSLGPDPRLYSHLSAQILHRPCKTSRCHLHPGYDSQLALLSSEVGPAFLGKVTFGQTPKVCEETTWIASTNVLGWTFARYVRETARKPAGLELSKQWMRSKRK